MLRSRRRRRAVAFIFWGFVVPLSTVLLLEASLRVYDYFSPSFVFPDNSHNRLRGKPFSNDYGFQLNSKGFKDIEYTPHKSSGVYRIAAFGDSFAFGVVPYQYNYLTLLDDKLDSTHRHVELINMAIPATGPQDYHSVLIKEGFAYVPDMVIFSVFIGSLGSERRESFTLHFAKYLLNILPQYQGVVVHKRATYEDESPTLSARHFLKIQLQRSQIFLVSEDELADSMSDAIDYIRQAADVCRAREIQFLVVLIPDQMQVDETLQAEVIAVSNKQAEDYNFFAPNKLVIAQLRAAGVDVIDLYPAFTQHDGEQELYKPRDTHWNIAGNKLVAEVLYEYLTRQYFKQNHERSTI